MAAKVTPHTGQGEAPEAPADGRVGVAHAAAGAAGGGFQHGASFALLGDDVKGLVISQRIELAELVCGWETANKYDAFPWDPSVGLDSWKDGKSDMLLFKLRERSGGCTGCCIRQCCGKARPFMLDATPSETLVPGAAANHEAIVCDRPYKCTTLCLCRPVVRISHPATGDLCEVVNTFGCENAMYWPFQVRKPTWEGAKPMDGLESMPEVWYYLRGYRCQPSAWCSCPSGPCSRVEIKIYEDAACETQVGMLAKVFSGCFKELLTDADSFVLEFPPNALPLQKSALMATTVLLDMLMFEKA